MPPARLVVVIDSGTTNSRVRLLGEGDVIGAASVQVGVVDTTKTGSNAALKQGVRRAFDQALRDGGVSVGEIPYALGFGMITSELGVVEIPHLAAPVGIRELAAGMLRFEPAEDFLPIPTYFVRGVKNPAPRDAGIGHLPHMDFMRGEEAQVMGLLALYRPALPATIVVLSSHTKFISVDAEGRIIGSVTTLSGQLFAALCKETFIGSAVREVVTDPEPAAYFDAGIVEEAHRIVTSGGLTRSLLMPRFMHVLMQTRWYERKLFLESLIAADDLQSVRDFTALGFPTSTSVYLVGPPARCAVHRHLIERHRVFGGKVTDISEAAAIDRLGPAGALEIFRHRPRRGEPTP